jgi:hypothetical protein
MWCLSRAIEGFSDLSVRPTYLTSAIPSVIPPSQLPLSIHLSKNQVIIIIITPAKRKA